MTLLDAPAFDDVRDRRNRRILFASVGAVGVLILAWWMAAGLPIDWPWTWDDHWRGSVAVDRFLKAVEAGDLPKAYGVWIVDKDWQQHQSALAANPYDRFLADRGYAGKQGGLDKDLAKKLSEDYGNSIHDKDWQRHRDALAEYAFSRFQEDWSPAGQGNDYGVIKSHSLAAARMYGNVLVVGVYINGRKSKALFLSFDTKIHTLGFSPVELYLGP